MTQLIYNYTCRECYTAYEIEMHDLGSSEIAFLFLSDDAIIHIDATLNTYQNGASHTMIPGLNGFPDPEE